MRKIALDIEEEFFASSILLVDDRQDNLEVLEAILNSAGFNNVHLASGGQEGLQKIDQIMPDLVVLDLMMPGVDGFAVLESLRSGTYSPAFLPVLVYTADLGDTARLRALSLGASDFLVKPGNAIEILLRIVNFLRMKKMHCALEDKNDLLEAKVTLRTQHLATARREAIEVLARVSEYHDDQTGQHAKRVGELCASIAERMGMEPHFIDSIRLAAQLHDIGKVAVPLDILLKTGKLEDEEMTILRQHAKAGAELLGDRQSPLLRLAREVALYHHERWDGRGYPCELEGEDIPVGARVVAVADTYDAMVSDRPYRLGCSQEIALSEIAKCSGTQFDPKVVEAIHALFGVEFKGKTTAA